MIQLCRPSRGYTSQRYGNIQPDGNPHAGQDFAYRDNETGETFPEVYAAADGVVLFAGDSRGLSWPNIMYLNIDFDRTDNVDTSAGNYTIIAHFDSAGNRVALTGYGHQEEVWVTAGQTVKAGQQIGVVGQTGFSAGKHLHFDLVLAPFRVDVAPYYGRVDPNPYFTGELAYASSITPASSIITELEEAGVALTQADLVAIQGFVQTERATVVEEVRANAAATVNAVTTALDNAVWAIKTFDQSTDNENGDRVINDFRGQLQTIRDEFTKEH